MRNKIDLIQCGVGEDIQTIDEIIMRYSCQELTASLINIKNNIRTCIQDLECTIYIKPSLIQTMKKSMKNLERAKEVIDVMKHCNFQSISTDPFPIINGTK